MEIELEFKEDDEQLNEKKEILEKLGLKSKYSIVKEGKTLCLPKELVQAIRISVLSDEEVYFADVDNRSEDLLSMISPINEFRTLKFLKRKVVELQKIPSDYDWNVFVSDLRERSNCFSSNSKQVGGIFSRVSDILQERPMQVDSDPKVQRLFEWAVESNIIYNKNLKSGIFTSTGRGIYSESDINQGNSQIEKITNFAKDDIVIRLPRNLLFNIEAAMNVSLTSEIPPTQL